MSLLGAGPRFSVPEPNESQKQKIAGEQRREELHEAKMVVAQAKADKARVGIADYKDDVTKAEELIMFLEQRELAARRQQDQA